MELVLPSTEYEKSFRQAVEEFRHGKGNKETVEQSLVKRYDESASFFAFVEKFFGETKGKFLPEGYVANTTFWLVEGDNYIGSVNIRHTLTPHLLEVGGHIGYTIRPSERGKGYGNMILELALPKAKELGIMDVLVTCKEDNIASAKVIEKNGGVLEDTRTHTDGITRRRYWIHLE